MDSVVEELRAMRVEIERLINRVERPLPLVLTKKRAAKELSIGITKLKGLISAGLITTVMMDKVAMISAREVRRVADEGTKPSKKTGSRPARKRALRVAASPVEEAGRLREMLKAKRKT